MGFGEPDTLVLRLVQLDPQGGHIFSIHLLRDVLEPAHHACHTAVEVYGACYLPFLYRSEHGGTAEKLGYGDVVTTLTGSEHRLGIA